MIFPCPTICHTNSTVFMITYLRIFFKSIRCFCRRFRSRGIIHKGNPHPLPLFRQARRLVGRTGPAAPQTPSKATGNTVTARLWTRRPMRRRSPSPVTCGGGKPSPGNQHKRTAAVSGGGSFFLKRSGFRKRFPHYAAVCRFFPADIRPNRNPSRTQSARVAP